MDAIHFLSAWASGVHETPDQRKRIENAKSSKTRKPAYSQVPTVSHMRQVFMPAHAAIFPGVNFLVSIFTG